MNDIEIRPVQDREYEVLAWLWQCFRHDLAEVVLAVPYPDGRYQPAGLPTGPSDDAAAYLVWQPHPRTGEPAPVGFTVVKGLRADRNNLSALWVAPPARRSGLGRWLALETITRHPGAWTVAFQEANQRAARFWRRTADEAFGPGNWSEVERAVPHDPALPPDHWIESN